MQMVIDQIKSWIRTVPTHIEAKQIYHNQIIQKPSV